VTSETVHLRVPAPADAEGFLAAVARSKKLHGRWVEPPSTPSAYAAYVRRLRRRTHSGYLVFTREGELAGVINISEIVRGAFCSGYLGYYAFAPHQRKGYMSAGLRLVIERAFSRLGLHRLEANVQPGNQPSRRLVERVGFRLEGYSERYLKIAGRWRDHERWALTVGDWRKGSKRSETSRPAADSRGARANSPARSALRSRARL
jgi:ribosomal-protein-alanine N-acetyltransferase